MPIVTIEIVPELMTGDRQSQYEQIASGITDTIVTSTGAPAESVHVMVREVSDARHSVAGEMLRTRMARPEAQH